MRLYLVRHAEAATKRDDEDRNLTAQGMADARILADCLRPLSLSIYAIWHSKKPRSIQTAEALAPVVRTRRSMVSRDGLNSNSPVRPVAKEIQQAANDIMIVGHQPFLGRLAMRLLGRGASADLIALGKPSVLCLERDECLEWRVAWLIGLDQAKAFAHI